MESHMLSGGTSRKMLGVPVYLEAKAQLSLSSNSRSDDGPLASGFPAAESSFELHQMSLETALDNQQTMEESKPLVPKELNDMRHDKESFLLRKLKQDWDNYTWSKFMFSIPKRLIQTALHPLSKLSETAGNSVDPGDLRVAIFFAESDRMDREILYFLSVVAILFGWFHLVPSFFLHYSSPMEMWLWKISAAFITAQPLLTGIVLASITGLQAINQFLPISTVNFLAGLVTALVPLYIVSRLALIILAFLALRDLPENAHHTIDWISSIPHL